MARPVRLLSFALATSLFCAPLATAQRATYDSARVEVLQGRAVVLEEGRGAITVRRGEERTANGRAQLEIGAGSSARISWDGTCSAHVWGPASLEWSAPEGSIAIHFYELAWADLEARAGMHDLYLPADWHASFGRSAFHIRGLSGGPTEVRLHAGDPVVLDWRGGSGSVRPPFALYPGSNVRLDRPHFRRAEIAERRSRGAWRGSDVGAEQDAWPWRERSDTDEQVRERVALSGETQTMDELPGDPRGTVERIRSFESDGSSRVAPIRRRIRSGEDAPAPTYAQVPVVPVRPEVEIERREPPAAPRRRALESSPSTPEPRSVTRSRSSETSRRLDSATPRGTEAPRSASEIERPSDVFSTERASRAVRGRRVTFDPVQWRGLQLRQLNGTGEIAAERASGVEVRVLGQGRSKVFVSSGAPGPRWCFTPTMDLLMQPGSVAVFEADGTLRMSFGEIEEKSSIANRPSYGEIGD